MEQWEADLAIYYAGQLPTWKAIEEAQRVIQILKPHWRKEFERGKKSEQNRWQYQRRKGQV